MEIIQIKVDNADLVYTLFDHYRLFYKQNLNPSASRQFINQRLQKGQAIIFLARDAEHDENLGYTLLYPKFSSASLRKNWVLNDLFVAEDHRRRGIAEALIKKGVEFALTTGASFVQLATAHDNYIAQSVYERLGFNKVGTIDNFLIYKYAL